MLQLVGPQEQAGERHQGGDGGRQRLAGATQLDEHEHGHERVDGPHQVGAPHKTQLGQQEQREHQGGHQGPEVVNGENPAEQLHRGAPPEGGEGLDQQGDLQADEHPDDQAHGAEHHPVQPGVAEGQVQDEHRVAAHQPQQHLVDGEAGSGLPAQVVHQQGAEPHTEQGDACG